MKLKIKHSTWAFIAVIFLFTVLLYGLLYPDLWFFHDRRLLISHESEIPFERTFVLVSQFFHGGIQLWDRYDQMNNAFFVSTDGVYDISNLMAALVYVLLSPFLSHPGQSLYLIHLVVFYGMTTLIRTIGGYLLLRRLISNKVIIGICLLYLNTIFTCYMFTPGLEQQGVYNFLPLLMYFVLCFFEEMRLRFLLLAALVMSFCLLGSPYFALGYFYQALHFFILSCLIFWIFQRRWRTIKSRPALPKGELFQNLMILASCLVMVLPLYCWSHALTHDFYVHGSGLSGTQGRFNNAFHFKAYFNMFNKGFANGFQFLGTALDYHHNVWGTTWCFLGASTLGLSIAALVLSKDKRKYIFASAILCVILINNAWFPEQKGWLEQAIHYANTNVFFWARGMRQDDFITTMILGISTAIHSLNALTNPFAFLVRSFHMTSLLLGMMLLPLLALGLKACFDLWQQNQETVYLNRQRFLLAMYGLIVLWAWLDGTQTLSVGILPGAEAAGTLKTYIITSGMLFFCLILAARIPVPYKWFFWIIFGLLFVGDIYGLYVYNQGYGRDYPDHIQPVRLSPGLTHQAVVPDFQNPQILPLREFLNIESNPISPTIIGGPLCMYGALYQYTPIGRFFHPWSIYEPRPMSYKDLYPDLIIQQYLKSNHRSMFFADYGFDERYLQMKDIVRLNLTDRVALVTADAANKPFLKTNGRFKMPASNRPQRVYVLNLDWHKAIVQRTSYGWAFQFSLPSDFPSYLSTSIFTDDYFNWTVMAGSKNLRPMQGMLTEPYSFDVQNIYGRQLTVLWPTDKIPNGLVQLQVKLPQGLVDLKKNTDDDLSLMYQAPADGWLVFNWPYDPKWEISVDGQKTAPSIVNHYFMGTPISSGQHQIRLRYWPRALLRPLILLSMIVSLISFFSLIVYSIRHQPL